MTECKFRGIMIAQSNESRTAEALFGRKQYSRFLGRLSIIFEKEGKHLQEYKMSKAQARMFAAFLKDDIAQYIKSHQTEYKQYLEEQGKGGL